MILLMDLQMLGENTDSFRDEGDLNLRRAGISRVRPIFTNNLAGIYHVENLPEIGTGSVAGYLCGPS